MPGIFLLLPQKGLYLAELAVPTRNKQTNKRFEPSLVYQFHFWRTLISSKPWNTRLSILMGAQVWTSPSSSSHTAVLTVTSLEQVQPHVWRQDTGFVASWPGWWVAKDGKTHPMWSELGALPGRPCTLGLPWSPLRPGHPRSSAHVLI